MMAAAVMAQRSAFDPIKLAADFQRIFTLFSETKDRGNFLEQLFVYVLNVSDIPHVEINKAFDSIPPNIKENIMTTYCRMQIEEQLKGEQIGIQKGEQIGIQKGEQIGIQKGEQIGIQKGELKRQTEIILSLHEDQIPLVQIAKYTNLTVEEVKNILKGSGKL